MEFGQWLDEHLLMKNNQEGLFLRGLDVRTGGSSESRVVPMPPEIPVTALYGVDLSANALVVGVGEKGDRVYILLPEGLPIPDELNIKPGSLYPKVMSPTILRTLASSQAD